MKSSNNNIHAASDGAQAEMGMVGYFFKVPAVPVLGTLLKAPDGSLPAGSDLPIG